MAPAVDFAEADLLLPEELPEGLSAETEPTPEFDDESALPERPLWSEALEPLFAPLWSVLGAAVWLSAS